MADMTERTARSSNGIAMLLLGVLGLPGLAILFFLLAASTSGSGTALFAILGVLTIIAAVVVLIGLYTLQPNYAGVLTLFGDYRGTDRTPGLRWANPLYLTRKVSLRVRNFTTETSKVNDANGNPILIACNVVWKVTDSARAVFGVDDFEHYVRIQSESAIRQLARSYPYDSFDDDVEVTTLIGDTGDVNQDLLHELQERADDAGVEVLEARITDLSYAPEIAEAMLRRQQASAIVAARTKIVEGAVLMGRDAIAQLEEGTEDGDAIPLDSDRKATFASNLMTVIASDAPTNPVVNVGTLNR